MDKFIRTDIASELIKSRFSGGDDICRVSTLRLSGEQAKRYNKAEGKYTTIETHAISDGDVLRYGRISDEVAKILLTYCKRPESVLVAGLGNADMTADALGSLTVSTINTSAKRLRALRAGVMGETGIESFDIIKGVCDRIKPSVVIVIDSLAAASTERVCNVIQFSDGGITPGSGVANHRKTISEETLGVKVISVGIPLVVHASTIIGEANGESGSAYINSLIVTPKDIDILVRECAHILSSGINSAYA